MTLFDKIHALIVHYTDLLVNHHTVELHALDMDLVQIQETGHFHNTLRLIDLLLDPEILDRSGLDRVLKHKTK